MGAIKAIVDTLATAVKSIVDTATGAQGDKKMNLGGCPDGSSGADQDDPSGMAAQASNTLMDRELARMQGMQMQQMAQNMANQQNGNNGGNAAGQSIGGIRG